MKYELTKPCPKCPFRNDIRPYLPEERVREIEDSLERGQFSCHATNEFDDGETIETDDSQHCAGALILLEREERPSQMMRICERLGSYDRRKLDMGAPVYDSFDAMAEAAADQGPKPKRRRRKASSRKGAE